MPEPLTCPKCGNSSEYVSGDPKRQGLTYCWLEWRIAPVEGSDDEHIYVDFEEQDFASPTADDQLRSARVPSPEEDLSRYHCNACGHEWYDGRNRNDVAALRRKERRCEAQ